jgi:membrane-associated protease RseP (regulator of RpoE activity)
MASPNSSLRSVLILVAGFGVFVAGLTAMAGWELPLVLGCIIVIVMVHEFGHYITAKRAGMLVTDFFVGFGPVVWSTTIGETRYGIRALLLGGYVKVPGMTWTDEIPAEQESRTYRSATYPRKVLFASAGSFMHLVMALLLAWGSLTFIGVPQANAPAVTGFYEFSGQSKNPAQAGGLHTGDRFLTIDSRVVTSVNFVVDAVRRHANQSLTMVVRRNGRDLTLHVTPLDGRTVKVNGVPLATGATPQGYLGINLQDQVVPVSWYAAVPKAVQEVSSTVVAALHALVHVFSPGEVATLARQVAHPAAAQDPANQLTRPVSIVGVVRIADQAATSNVPAFLLILMNLNIFVGVLNMLPMLPLDGGYVAIASYERLRTRRRQSYHADLRKLAPFIYVFMTALGLLFVSTLWLDVVSPIRNPFQ